MKHFYDRKECFNLSEPEAEQIDYGIEEDIAVERPGPEEPIENYSDLPTTFGPIDTEGEEQEDSDETIIDDEWNDFVVDSEYVPIPAPTRENSPIPPTPRRSERIMRPVYRLNYLAKSVLSKLFIIMLSIPVDASLTKIPPILWRKSDKPVISGINNVIVSVKFNSPCEVFTGPIFNGTAQSELHRWCKDTILRTFLSH
jgi:hypothetical protein